MPLWLGYVLTLKEERFYLLAIYSILDLVKFLFKI